GQYQTRKLVQRSVQVCRNNYSYRKRMIFDSNGHHTVPRGLSHKPYTSRNGDDPGAIERPKTNTMRKPAAAVKTAASIVPASAYTVGARTPLFRRPTMITDKAFSIESLIRP